MAATPQALSADEELALLLEQEARDRRERNEIFKVYRAFLGRYAVLIGGSGSGKSYEVADKHVDRLVHEDGHRILCVRAEQKQISESQFPLIENRIEERYDVRDFKINRSNGKEKIFHKPTGNEFIFWGLDDVAKLKSIFDITSIWIEEADQTTDATLRELDRRLRGYQGTNESGSEKYMQISLSFNPVSVLSWLKKRFFDNKEDGQIMLHGIIPFTDCEPYKGFECPDLSSKVYAIDEVTQKRIERYKHNTLVAHSTFRDNKFIDDTYLNTLAKLLIEDEDEYNIYALGMWGITGGTFFDKGNVNRRIMDNPQPIKTGFFEFAWNDAEACDKILGEFKYDPADDSRYSEQIRWVDDPDGDVRLYELPEYGYPYVSGGDTAGDGSDFNTGCFTNNATGADAATIRTLLDEDEYARQMYCLGRYYNDALLGIETNFSTHPVKELLRLGYHNQYVREETPDKYTGKLVPRFGFRTDKLTRPLALGMLRTVVREHPELIMSLDTLHEMTTFVKNEKGKPEASRGAHDDMVLARAINCYIAPQQTRKVRDKPIDVPVIKSHKEKLAKRNTAHIRRARLV